jgi:hypothetical protein
MLLVRVDGEFQHVAIVQRLWFHLAAALRGGDMDELAAGIPRLEHCLKVGPGRLPRQGVKMQRHRHEHPLAIMAN